MSFKEFQIGEVGCGGPISVTGLSFDNCHYGLPFGIPRIVFIEPESSLCMYNDVNKSYQESVERSGNCCIREDIYNYHPEWNRFNLGFLALENVVNDPAYWGKKNFSHLVENITSMISLYGIVFFSDSFRPSPRTISSYNQIRQLMVQSGFTVVVDELSYTRTFPNFYNEPLFSAKYRIVRDLLANLQISDEPLFEGLEGQLEELWMVFKKSSSS